MTDGVLLRLRAESLDWAAGLLAGAGCSFAVLRPDELRAQPRRAGLPTDRRVRPANCGR